MYTAVRPLQAELASLRLTDCGLSALCTAGLTPAQVQLLMNAPAHQVNALAAQLGMLDTGARPGNMPGNLPGNLGAPAPNLAANQAMLQQQKLAAARANFASQQAQAQRTPANPMPGLQQPPQQPLMGLQQARPVTPHCSFSQLNCHAQALGRMERRIRSQFWEGNWFFGPLHSLRSVALLSCAVYCPAALPICI